MQKFPKEFTIIEQHQALELLSSAGREVTRYEGKFNAPWLLSSIDATIWKISKGEETRNIDGEAINFYQYNWSTKLYDGSNLIDLCNASLLANMQRIAFLAREMPGGPNTLTTFKSFLWSINLLARWSFVYDDILNPRHFFFSKLTHQHFTDFFTSMGKGGAIFALRYPERLLQATFPAALGRDPTAEEMDAPLNIALEDCRNVSIWLKRQGFLSKIDRSTSGDEVFKTSKIAELLGVDSDSVRGGPRWKAFISQFDFHGNNSSDIRSDWKSTGRRAMSSQHSLSLDEAREAGTSEKTLHKYFDDFKVLVALHRHLPEICPDPSVFRPQDIKQIIIMASVSSNHTPWVPLHIAMTYTTEALRWVHVYGEDLVSLFLSTYKNLHTQGLLVSAPEPHMKNPTYADYTKIHKEFSVTREQYVSTLVPQKIIRPINISGWASYVHLDGQKAFEKLKNAPSMLDAIMILVGAITIVVAMVKPIRESEFRALKRECLHHITGDGYWLSQTIRKKNIEDVLPFDSRPIPAIAAKAIQLLRRLTDGIKEIVGVTDPWLLDSLLTLPSFGRYEAVIDNVVSAQQLNCMLDAFCDHIALPTDEKKRRWYLRIHEMRKSFLITFFWTYRYASLDAARWIANHQDSTHIYAYIQANFPGEELPGLEADYASQVLRDYQRSGKFKGTRDVEDLHRIVCEHFSVRDVSWIDEGMLKDWLEFQFETQSFQIIPYSIKTPDGHSATEIAFRITAASGLG